MTVRELKEKLNKYNDDMEVLIKNYNIEMVLLKGDYTLKTKGEIRAFENDGSYFKDIYVADEKNGKNTLILYY
jgi:hypothetical protein